MSNNYEKREAPFNLKSRDHEENPKFKEAIYFDKEKFESQRIKKNIKTANSEKKNEDLNKIKFIWTHMPEEVKNIKENQHSLTENKAVSNPPKFNFGPDNSNPPPLFNPIIKTNFLGLIKKPDEASILEDKPQINKLTTPKQEKESNSSNLNSSFSVKVVKLSESSKSSRQAVISDAEDHSCRSHRSSKSKITEPEKSQNDNNEIKKTEQSSLIIFKEANTNSKKQAETNLESLNENCNNFKSFSNFKSDNKRPIEYDFGKLTTPKVKEPVEKINSKTNELVKKYAEQISLSQENVIINSVKKSSMKDVFELNSLDNTTRKNDNGNIIMTNVSSSNNITSSLEKPKEIQIVENNLNPLIEEKIAKQSNAVNFKTVDLYAYKPESSIGKNQLALSINVFTDPLPETFKSNNNIQQTWNRTIGTNPFSNNNVNNTTTTNPFSNNNINNTTNPFLNYTTTDTKQNFNIGNNLVQNPTHINNPFLKSTIPKDTNSLKCSNIVTKNSPFEFNFNQNREVEKEDDDESEDDSNEKEVFNIEDEQIIEASNKPNIKLGEIEQSPFTKIYKKNINDFAIYSNETKKYASIGVGIVSLEYFVNNKNTKLLYIIFRNKAGNTLFQARIMVDKCKVERQNKNFNYIIVLNCFSMKKVNLKDEIELKYVKLTFINEEDMKDFITCYNNVKNEY